MSQALVGGPKSVGAPLRRHHSDRWLGGVAGGIARYVGTDPTLIRAAIVLLTVMGGAGVPIYITAALLMPADGESSSVAERLLKNNRGEWSKPAVVVAALLAITVFGAQSDGVIGSLFPLLLVGGGVYLLANRSGGHTSTAQPPPPVWGAPTSGAPSTSPMTQTAAPDMASTPHTASNAAPPPPVVTGSSPPPLSALPPPPPGSTAVGLEEEDPLLAAARELDAEIYDPTPSWQPYTYEPEPVSVVPKRRRNPLVGIALSVLVIAGGLTILSHAAGILAMSFASFAAFGLVVVGGALVLSRPLGGARVLIPVGAVLFLMALIPGGSNDFDAVRNLDGLAGDHTVAPAQLDGPLTEYRYGAGDVMIDLSAIDIVGEQQQVTASLGFGDITIRVPDDVKVVATAAAGAGDINLFGRESSGYEPSDQVTLNNDMTGGILIIDASIKAGDLTLVQVPRTIQPLPESIVRVEPIEPIAPTEPSEPAEPSDRIEQELESQEVGS